MSLLREGEVLRLLQPLTIAPSTQPVPRLVKDIRKEALAAVRLADRLAVRSADRLAVRSADRLADRPVVLSRRLHPPEAAAPADRPVVLSRRRLDPPEAAAPAEVPLPFTPVGPRAAVLAAVVGGKVFGLTKGEPVFRFPFLGHSFHLDKQVFVW